MPLPTPGGEGTSYVRFAWPSGIRRSAYVMVSRFVSWRTLLQYTKQPWSSVLLGLSPASRHIDVSPEEVTGIPHNVDLISGQGQCCNVLKLLERSTGVVASWYHYSPRCRPNSCRQC